MTHFIAAKLWLFICWVTLEIVALLWLWWPCWRGGPEIKRHNGLWLCSADVGCWHQIVRSRYVCSSAQGRAMSLMSLQIVCC